MRNTNTPTLDQVIVVSSAAGSVEVSKQHEQGVVSTTLGHARNVRNRA
jgi:hypothetical protein